MVSKTALVFLLACVFQGYNALPVQSGDLQELLREAEAALASIDNFSTKNAEIKRAADNEVARVVSTHFLIEKGIIDLPVIKCALEQAGVVKKIVLETSTDVTKCMKDAASAVGDLKPQLDAIRKQLFDEIKKAKPIIVKCIKDNLTKPTAAIECIKNEGADVYVAITKILQQLNDLAASHVNPALAEAVECTQSSVTTAHSQFLNVIKNYKDCVVSSM